MHPARPARAIALNKRLNLHIINDNGIETRIETRMTRKCLLRLGVVLSARDLLVFADPDKCSWHSSCTSVALSSPGSHSVSPLVTSGSEKCRLSPVLFPSLHPGCTAVHSCVWSKLKSKYRHEEFVKQRCRQTLVMAKDVLRKMSVNCQRLRSLDDNFIHVFP